MRCHQQPLARVAIAEQKLRQLPWEGALSRASWKAGLRPHRSALARWLAGEVAGVQRGTNRGLCPRRFFLSVGAQKRTADRCYATEGTLEGALEQAERRF